MFTSVKTSVKRVRAGCASFPYYGNMMHALIRECALSLDLFIGPITLRVHVALPKLDVGSSNLLARSDSRGRHARHRAVYATVHLARWASCRGRSCRYLRKYDVGQ